MRFDNSHDCSNAGTITLQFILGKIQGLKFLQKGNVSWLFCQYNFRRGSKPMYFNTSKNRAKK